jgi:hypothetical protein
VAISVRRSRLRTRVRLRGWRSLGKWHFGYLVSILERGNQPLARLLLQDLNLNALLRFRKAFWGPGSNHSPANVRYRNLGSQELNIHFFDGEDALSKNEYVRICEFFLNLGTPLPPPAHHVNQICIFSKQIGIRFGVVSVPRLLLSCFHVTNISLILIVRTAERNLR